MYKLEKISKISLKELNVESSAVMPCEYVAKSLFLSCTIMIKTVIFHDYSKYKLKIKLKIFFSTFYYKLKKICCLKIFWTSLNRILNGLKGNKKQIESSPTVSNK